MFAVLLAVSEPGASVVKYLALELGLLRLRSGSPRSGA